MSAKMYVPTAVGLALANAAFRHALTTKNPKADQSNWITRKVLIDTEEEAVGMRRINSTNARLKHGTAEKLKANGVL